MRRSEVKRRLWELLKYVYLMREKTRVHELSVTQPTTTLRGTRDI